MFLAPTVEMETLSLHGGSSRPYRNPYDGYVNPYAYYYWVDEHIPWHMEQTGV